MSTWVILAFVIYMIFMLGIGIITARKNKSSDDYFLGGRNLGGWVTALSAQASDMSGWMLMGLPGLCLCIWCESGLDSNRSFDRYDFELGDRRRSSAPLYDQSRQCNDDSGVSEQSFPR